MRRDAVFRRFMHLKSADLYFKRCRVFSDQRRVERLIHISLRHCDIILKTPRYRLIHFMNDAKRGITILHRIHNDPDRKQIIYLIDRFILIFHFFINTEKMFDTPVNLRFDPGVADMLADFINDRLNIFFPHILADRNFVYQIIVNVRFQILKRKIVQFNLQF